MPAPTLTTPIQELVKLCEALPAWFDAHQEALQEELDEEPAQLSATLDGLAARLKQAEEDFSRERREDVGVTRQRNALRADINEALVSLSSTLKLAVKDPEALAVAQREVLPTPASGLFNDLDQEKALARAVQGLKLQQAVIDARKPRVERLTQRLNALQGRNAALQELEQREATETQEAARARDQLRAQALELYRTFSLASRAIRTTAPAPQQALQELSNRHIS